ncbi:MAG: hypothetical protein N3A71_03585 [Candidatus Dojkabacteria bacterium]|nr:hypothetical protein [Candidatus Dojkabacteria bacterium]
MPNKIKLFVRIILVILFIFTIIFFSVKTYNDNLVKKEFETIKEQTVKILDVLNEIVTIYKDTSANIRQKFNELKDLFFYYKENLQELLRNKSNEALIEYKNTVAKLIQKGEEFILFLDEYIDINELFNIIKEKIATISEYIKNINLQTIAETYESIKSELDALIEKINSSNISLSTKEFFTKFGLDIKNFIENLISTIKSKDLTLLKDIKDKINEFIVRSKNEITVFMEKLFNKGNESINEINQIIKDFEKF